MKRNVIILVSFFLISLTSFAQTSDPTLPEILDLIHKDSLKRTVQDMQDFGSRLCYQSVGQNRKVAQYLVDRLKAYNIENARIDSFFVSLYHPTLGVVYQFIYNVLGTLEGTGATEQTVIIGAHLDAVSRKDGILTATSPGADDNATGCAVMIEMARICHENSLKPFHNIDFMAYDAEESGLIGSHIDAEKRQTLNENIIVMLNNDMVGYQPDNIPWEVSLRPYDNSFDVTENAEKAFINYTTVKPILATQFNAANSDSYAYYHRGYKACFSIELNFSPYYHSENDLTEYLNFEFCRQIARMNFVLLDYYAQINLPISVIENKKNFEDDITVFPNPARDFIRILNYYNINIQEIEIYDISGKLMQSVKSIENQQNMIQLNHYCRGVYFLKIFTDKGIVNKKIMIN